MRPSGSLRARRRLLLVCLTATAALVALVLTACGVRAQRPAAGPPGDSQRTLPAEPFTHAPAKAHDRSDLVFTFDQLEHHYRLPGEFTHRLTGDEYGFEKLSVFITETHPGGGPGLHVHDVEEAHVLLEGTALYRVGDATFTVHAPYVARVPSGVPHTFVNAGSEPFNLVAVFASNHPSTKRIGPNPLVDTAPK